VNARARQDRVAARISADHGIQAEDELDDAIPF
jgi:hypothetical protein